MMQYAEQGTGSRSGSSNSRTGVCEAGVKQRAFGLGEVCLAISSAKVTHECLNVLGQRLHGATAGERQLSESSLASTWTRRLNIFFDASLHFQAADASGVSLDDLLKPAIEAEHELRNLFATDKSHGRPVDAHVGLVDVFDAPDAIRVTRALVQVVQDDQELAKYAARGFEVHYPANLRREDVYPSIYERPLTRIDGLGRLLVLGKLSIRADPQSILWGKPNPLRRYNIMDASGMSPGLIPKTKDSTAIPHFSARLRNAWKIAAACTSPELIDEDEQGAGRERPALHPRSHFSLDEAEWISQAYISPTEKLFTAIAACDREAVLNLLVDIDLNRRDCVDRTPLHMAILSGAPDIACDLVHAGTRITAQTEDGRSSLHLAASWTSSRCHLPARFNIFHYMCDKNHIELLQHLLHNKLPPDVVEALLAQQSKSLLQTPLHIAVQKGHTDAVRALLEFSAESLHLRDANGCTALHAAVQAGFPVTIVRLADAAPEGLGLENGAGHTPLEMAVLQDLIASTQWVAEKRWNRHTGPGVAWDAFYADCCDAKDPSRTLVIVRAGLAHYGPIARQLVHRVEVQASVEARLAHANSEPGNIRGGAYLQALQGSLVYRKMHMFATTACTTKVDFRKDLGPCLKGHRKVRCKVTELGLANFTNAI
ncbi:ankyrin repeat-containing domain protein [Mycena galopus ATCC 62051]|nr:ankyrin repeat-containing domain protein [Mycena galopus ATCC 62051]